MVLDPLAESIAVLDPLADSIADLDPLTDSITDLDPLADSIANLNPLAESNIDLDPLTDSIVDLDPLAESVAAIDPLAEFRSVNTEGTLNLARQAATVGVRRFIFLSTIGVNGNSTSHGKNFTETSASLPHDPYSVSKHEAEVGLRAISKSTGMELVIIRPTLVHGSKAPGNFGKLD